MKLTAVLYQQEGLFVSVWSCSSTVIPLRANDVTLIYTLTSLYGQKMVSERAAAPCVSLWPVNHSRYSVCSRVEVYADQIRVLSGMFKHEK